MVHFVTHPTRHLPLLIKLPITSWNAHDFCCVLLSVNSFKKCKRPFFFLIKEEYSSVKNRGWTSQGMCQLAVNYSLLCPDTTDWKCIKFFPSSHLQLLPEPPSPPQTPALSGSSSPTSASAAVTTTIAFLRF